MRSQDAGGRIKPPDPYHRRRLPMLAAAALLFAGVFALRVAIEDPNQLVTPLFVLPIAIVAAELGVRWGLAMGVLALGLFWLWDLGWAASGDQGTFDYLTRAVTFLVLGGSIGVLADRLRKVSAERTRFWDLATDLLCTAGFDGYFRLLSPGWDRALGWTREELRSQPFIDFVHPEDRERTRAEAAKLSSGAETLNFENRYRHKDGSYRWLLWSATSVVAEEVIYAVARDFTERKRAQEMALEQQARTREILDHAHDAFVSIDSRGVITAWNPSAETIFGWSREEALGRRFAETIVPRQHREAHIRGIERFLADGEGPLLNKRLELTALHRDRGEFPVELTISPLEGADGYSFHAFLRDVTERKRAAAVLAEAKEEAERANRAKSEFLSRMSHELRTPLNAIIGFAQLLELDEPDPKQREGVDQILKGGRHLLELINEVLDISRIESGTMAISLEPVHVGTALAEALSLIRSLADEARVKLDADPSELEEVYVLADQQRLKQVLINLLSNAVKYNREGGSVTVSFQLPSDERLLLAIADTGPGLSERQLEALFDPFERLGAERTEIEGTGLGLALSKRLVEIMGGRIEADSKPGEGTTMRVELEVVDSPELDQGTPADQAGAEGGGAARERRTVLYVEDNLSNMRLVEQAIKRLPEVRLLPAMHGRLGLDLARQHRPDLVLLDLHLPDLHGKEVLKRLKDDPVTAEIPVVVVSADATAGQVERLRTAGAADYLTKPIDVQRLLELVTGLAT